MRKDLWMIGFELETPDFIPEEAIEDEIRRGHPRVVAKNLGQYTVRVVLSTETTNCQTALSGVCVYVWDFVKAHPPTEVRKAYMIGDPHDFICSMAGISQNDIDLTGDYLKLTAMRDQLDGLNPTGGLI